MFGLNRGGAFNFPIVLDRDVTTRPTEACIHGEVFLVDIPSMLSLDRLEQNGVMYQRELVKVRNPDYSPEPFEAWMYVGMQTYWSKHKKHIALCGRNEEFNIYKWTLEHERANCNYRNI
jgi:hypothetical protein